MEIHFKDLIDVINDWLYERTAQPKMANAIFGFGLTHAPHQSQEFDRKNIIVGQVRGKASTANNNQFGAMAGMLRWKILTISKFRGSWQM